MAGGARNKRTDRKKGVPFKMMFRHHMDPSYYDPKANDKIFVPDVSDPKVLTEEQKRIVESFPEKDRGLYGKEDKEGQAAVEEDALEAAVKKMKIRKEHRIREKTQKDTNNKDRRVKFADEADEDSEDSAEYFEGSDEEEEEDYGSEGEEEYDSE